MEPKLILTAAIGISLIVVYHLLRLRFVDANDNEIMKQEEDHIFGAIEDATSIDDLNEAEHMIEVYDYKYQSFQGVADKVTKMGEALRDKSHEIITGLIVQGF